MLLGRAEVVRCEHKLFEHTYPIVAQVKFPRGTPVDAGPTLQRADILRQTGAVRILSSDPVRAVHDLDLAADWFTPVLGCQKSERDPGKWTFCSAGIATFMLGRCPDALPATDLGDHNYIA